MIRWRQSVSTLGRAALPTLALLGLALASSLAGCVAAGAGRMPAEKAAFPIPDLSFTMRDGFVLPARQWLPPAGVAWRGVILALHGFADSRDAWEYPAPGFAAAGYAVVAPDQRGFGATAGRGMWAGTATMVDDAQELAGQMRRRYPGQRLIVMGESMGGAVALCLAARPANNVDATVLLAPAVWGRAQMGPAMVGLLSVANGVTPNWVLSGSDVPKDIAASDNREALLRLFQDPLTERGSRVSMLSGIVDLMTEAQRAAPGVNGPVLILDGRRDQVIPPEATAAAWARLPPSVRRAFYPSGFHLLLRDNDRALVEADILSWLETPDEWLPSGADINAAAWQSDHAWEGQPPAELPARLLDGTGQRHVWPY